MNQVMNQSANAAIVRPLSPKQLALAERQAANRAAKEAARIQSVRAAWADIIKTANGAPTFGMEQLKELGVDSRVLWLITAVVELAEKQYLADKTPDSARCRYLDHIAPRAPKKVSKTGMTPEEHAAAVEKANRFAIRSGLPGFCARMSGKCTTFLTLSRNGYIWPTAKAYELVFRLRAENPGMMSSENAYLPTELPSVGLSLPNTLWRRWTDV